MTSCKCTKCKCVIESTNERSNFVCEFCESGNHIKKPAYHNEIKRFFLGKILSKILTW